ncbi:MAG: diguanylate cyclase [Solirubrobacteraceae bacterium]|nr:diguanylate cyclase [Solirubrobacteraceae bacterium]
MQKPTSRLTYVVPIVMVALGFAAIALIATLQGRADSARRAQLTVEQIGRSLEHAGALPSLVQAGQPAGAAAVDLKERRVAVSEGLRELRAGEPPADVVPAAEAIDLLGARVDASLVLARDRRLATEAGLAAVRKQVAQLDATNRLLARASGDYAARAAFARRQALQGAVLTVLLLLSVFAFFYTRSIQDHRIVRRLFTQNEELLAASRDEALTDALTGLNNRRALQIDLEAALPIASDDERVLLALFDLDGFKGYNDTFGHAAGDELLNRLGRNLTKAVEDLGAKAYRLGGDEFCVLTQIDELRSEALIEAAIAALTDEGDGWSIGTSVGTVWVPGDASDVETALVMADERMYSDKASRKGERPTLQSLTDGPKRRVEEGSVGRVAAMAQLIAEHLQLGGEEVEAVRVAADLHDIGKSSIPDSILAKEGELDDDEWAFVKKHTITGGRLAFAAHARTHTAALVRSSHEHFDGNGYPDGLAGEQIPLGARIIAVCDAYNAMTSDRPFRNAMPPGVALRELQSCAGSQFDPQVVEAFFASAAKDASAFKGRPLESRR